MNDIIIHISDLHITDVKETFGDMNKYTWLSTANEDENYAFVDRFITKIKEVSYRNRYLVITGDITNIGEEVEFEVATKVLTKVIDDLEIKKENVLLIPGDHEINRHSIIDALKKPENKGKEGHLLGEAKYKYFLPFYKQIKGVEFDFKKLIFDKIVIDRILLLGVNSNYKVGRGSSDGFLPIKEFDSEIAEILSTNPSKELVLAFHHNISGTYEDKLTGQWEKGNRKDLVGILQKHGVKLVLHGNEHTPKSEKLDSTEIYVSDSGAFAGKEPPGSYKVYEIIASNNSIKLKNNIFQLRKVNAVNEPKTGVWTTLLAREAGIELDSFDIYDGKPEPIGDPIELPSGETELAIVSESTEELILPNDIYENTPAQNRLYQIVKQKKLFHTGHFHWSESSRAHNWIDVAKLLEDNQDLYFVKTAIVDVIKTKSLADNCDLIIGLGSDGNIISSKAAIHFAIPQASLPYSYRYDESHEYERQLNFDNESGDYKEVLIITDVINDGRTLRKLIGHYEKDFFKNVQKINVIALFYTGQEILNSDILNFDRLPEAHDKGGDCEVNSIRFYAIKQLRVEKCPYGSNYRDDCFIYKDELSCVHLFYNEH